MSVLIYIISVKLIILSLLHIHFLVLIIEHDAMVDSEEITSPAGIHEDPKLERSRSGEASNAPNHKENYALAQAKYLLSL